MILVAAAGPDRDRTLCFSGDMGRRGMPILKPTATLAPADVLVCESTYGNRLHRSFDETVDRLYAVIRDTIERGGKVLIPAFSLGRTQLIIHVLQLGLRDGRIPRTPIYVDSPLASEVAEVYRAHPNSLSAEIARDLKEGHGLLGGDGVTYVRDFEQSTLLASRPGSSVIIASSGMCDAGRIQQHLKALVDDPRCSIVLVSYQAQGTTGRRLMEPKPTVRFQGRDWNKWIEVHHLDGFSGHADRDDFVAYLARWSGRWGRCG
jgi:metallo-beta-lactamase family protein